MGKRPPSTGDRKTTPPATQPHGEGGAAYGSSDHSFTLQTIVQVQNTLGRLENSVNTLVTSNSTLTTKVGRMEKVIYAAGLILVICLAVGGFMLSAAKDFALVYYKASLDAQNRATHIEQPAVAAPPTVSKPPAGK